MNKNLAKRNEEQSLTASKSRELRKRKNAIIRSKFLRILIIIFTALLILIVTNSAITPPRLELNEGDIATDNIVASRDITDRIETQRLKDSASEAVSTISVRDITVLEEAKANVDDFFIELLEIKNEYDMKYQKYQSEYNKNGLITRTNTLENVSPTPDTTPTPTPKVEPVMPFSEYLGSEFWSLSLQKLDLRITEDELNTLLEQDAQVLIQMRDEIKNGLEIVMSEEIDDNYDDISNAKNNLQNYLLSSNMSAELRFINYNIGYNLVEPNLIYDQAATDIAKENARNQVADVVYKKGQTIITKGQPITESQLAMLEELGILETGGFDMMFMLGLSIIFLVLFLLLSAFSGNFLKDKVETLKQVIVVCSVIIVCFMLNMLLYSFLGKYFSGGILVAYSVIMLMILSDYRVATMSGVLLTTVFALISNDPVLTIVIGFAQTILATLTLSHLQHRNNIILTGLLVGVVDTVLIAAFLFYQITDIMEFVEMLASTMISGILCGILALGTLPLWENIFKLLTPLKLMEYANPSQPILKRLMIETPGTYHHSLIVASLAERACHRINANALLARAGAMYHDIGKLYAPQYFSENQININLHDSLDPQESVRIIVGHVTEGITMAQKLRLPVELTDFIKSHHGDSVIKFFYHKALNKGQEPNVLDYRYDGPKPKSKEVAIVMLADTVEAAVRSMRESNISEIRNAIDKLINNILADGQLYDCDLTFNEIKSIKMAFMQVLSGLYHDREAYPDVKIPRRRRHIEK